MTIDSIADSNATLPDEPVCPLETPKIAHDALFKIIAGAFEDGVIDAAVYAQDHIRTAISYFQANSESHVALRIDAARCKSRTSWSS
jgi:hypothetical protein